MKFTDAEKEHLFLRIGGVYNNHKLANRYGSANGFIEEVIRIVEELIDNQAFKLYVDRIDEEVKRINKK